MANIASVFRDEIIRLARKEIRTETECIKKSSTQYRSEIAALKRHAVQIERRVKQLEKIITKTHNNSAEVKPESDAASKARFTAKGFKTLRQRLGLSAADTGLLIGVSAQSIYSWEAGTSSPRKQQLPNIVILRGMGKKEVAELLKKHAK